MPLKTFLDIYTLTCNRCKLDPTDVTEEEETIIKNAINYCYQSIVGKKEILPSKAYLPIIDGMVTLPDDVNDILSLDPVLLTDDRLIGNHIVTNRTDVTQFTLLYSVVRDPLVNDEDIPDISSKYFYTMTTYAAFSYYTYKKKNEQASIFYQQHTIELTDLITRKKDGYSIQDVYSYPYGDIYG